MTLEHKRLRKHGLAAFKCSFSVPYLDVSERSVFLVFNNDVFSDEPIFLDVVQNKEFDEFAATTETYILPTVEPKS